jgi:hypothetical protein
MSIARVVMGAGTVILLAIAIWMQVTHTTARGGYTRGGHMTQNTITPGAVFFFAAVFIAMYIMIYIHDRKQDKERL